jgi:hypothetical protein
VFLLARVGNVGGLSRSLGRLEAGCSSRRILITFNLVHILVSEQLLLPRGGDSGEQAVAEIVLATSRSENAGRA